MNLKRYRNENKGFTYIEMLIAMSIMTMISLALSMFISNVFTMNRYYSESLTAQEIARRTISVMSAEVRTLSPSSTGAYPIAQAEASSFIFYSDIDNDLFKEQIRYFTDGNVLKKGMIKPSGNPLSYDPDSEKVVELAHGLANGETPIFSYYDTSYDGTTQPLVNPIDVSIIRLVKVTLVIDSDPLNSPGPITVTTQINMRNVKDNL